MKRVGVIDIGSNSVRLVVFDGAARSPAYFYNEKVLCGLGRDLRESGVLHPEGRASAYAAIRRFVALSESMKLTALSAVATAAVREAADGAEFLKEIEVETGLRVMVATGREEATLSAQGVLLGWPEAEGLVCDMGGSSMELARIEKGTITRAETSELGPLMLQSMAEDERRAHVRDTLANLREMFPEKPERLYLVGGSWRAIARLDMARRDYPLLVLHEYVMTPEQTLETAQWCEGQSVETFRDMSESSQQRLSLVPDAAAVLGPLVSAFEPREVAISSYGIREGLLYAHMSKDIRKLDPLLEAAKNMELSGARFPGFGDALYKWIRPLFSGEPKERMRLIRAACYLHDVTWRAHPDYRAEVCFENVTRANLGGLNHRERVFLGFALLNRYKAPNETTRQFPATGLLSEDEMAEAARIGRAMRLGAMLAGGSVKLLRRIKLSADADTVKLLLKSGAEVHAGEVVRKRFEALAATLDRSAVIELENGSG